MRVDVAQAIGRRGELGSTDIRCAMDDLPLKIAEVDGILVDEPDRPHSGRGEVHNRGRSETAGADAEDPRRLEPALPVEADVRQREMPAVTHQLVAGQFHGHVPII